MPVENQTALATLMEMPNASARNVKKFIELYGSPEEAVKHVPDTVCADAAIDYMEKNNAKIISWKDSQFPQQLLKLKDHPALLTMQGTLHPKDSQAIAIVGTRHPTSAGIAKAYKIAYALAMQGYTIVSGLARGIDTAAHWGAIQAGGRTIAAIGSGLACMYPAENKALSQVITQNGALLSEYPIFAEPKRHHFPQRNRIIAGLSTAILLIEAPKTSGALIAMERAAKQGIPLFVLPGRPNIVTTQGNLNILRKHKATVVESAEELVAALNRHNPEQLTFSSLGFQRIGVN